MSDNYDGPLMAQQILRLQAAQHGMTLRDWFAGQAMQGLLSNPKLHQEIIKNGNAHGGWIEHSAWAWADAMLKAREVKP